MMLIKKLKTHEVGKRSGGTSKILRFLVEVAVAPKPE